MNRKLPADKLVRNLPIALRLTAEERQQAKQLADDSGRSTANFARQMYLRGLSSFLAEPRQVG